jgi:hypothetical protein
MNKALLFSVLGLVWASCERIIPFDPEDVDPVLVLYSDLNPHMPFKAHLSRSIGILDQGEPQRIGDAVVWVEDSTGAVVDTLRPGLEPDGFYYSPLKPAAGASYTVKALWRELPVVSGTARPVSVLGDFAMDSIGYSPGNGMFDSPHLIYQVTIDGSPGFYRLEFFEDGGDTTVQQIIFAGTDDPLVVQPVFGQDFRGAIEFDNALILGQQRDLVVRVYKWSLTSPTKMRVTKIDEATARYERSLRNAQNSGGPFTQPVPIFSNVLGGLGLVGGQGFLWVRP